MEELPFEEALRRLEEIVAELEQGEMTLEESLSAFQEGIAMLRLCVSKLNDYEGKIEVIMEEFNGEAPSWLYSSQDGGGRQK